MPKIIICSLAQRTSSIFASQGVPVYLFSKITPTPFVVSILFNMFIFKYLTQQQMLMCEILQCLFDVSEFFFVSD